MDEDVKHIELGTADNKSIAVMRVVREDGRALVLNMTPDTVLALISKLNVIYSKLIH